MYLVLCIGTDENDNEESADAPVHQRTSFDMGLITLKKCLVILFTLKKISFNIPVYQSITVKCTKWQSIIAIVSS